MDMLSSSLGSIQLVDEIERQVASMSRALGFDTFALGYVNPDGNDTPFWVTHMPKCNWDVTAAAARDPVTIEVINTKVPKTIVWGPDTYANAQAYDLWEQGSAVGLHSGIAHIGRPGGKRRMMLSMDRNGTFDGTREQEQERADKLARFSDLLAGTVVALFDNRSLIESDLTHQEREALKWIFAYGYTEFQISDRLGITLDHTRHLLHSATSKLGAGSYVQASMIAARYGALGVV